jgi:plastocyanin
VNRSLVAAVRRLVLLSLLVPGCAVSREEPAEPSSRPTTPCTPPSCVELQVQALDYAFNPPDLTAKSGTVRIVLTNEGKKVHNLKILGPTTEVRTPNLAAGAAGYVEEFLAPRRYDIFCTITGHTERGMRGTLTVTP